MHEKRLITVSSEDVTITSQQKNSCLLCPCPQLTAYWTPPPSCARRVCCCEASSKMSSFIFRDAKTATIFVCAVLVAYYFIMDIILFIRYKSVNIVDEAKPGPPEEIYSPFTHLTVKAIMNDPTSQYIVGPSAEYFDMITKFSSVFSFITPNMISFTHLALGLVTGKFIASENIYDRRIGVVMFQFRVWLDAFDGVVYRSQSNSRLQFKSVRSTLGYYVDMICDTLGGVFLCFGLLFYLFKRFDHCRQELPTFLPQELPGKSALPTNGHSSNGRETYSKKYLFWKVFCFGISLACAGKFWDSAVGEFEYIFQFPLSDPKLSVLQNEWSHSMTTIVLFYLWRIVEAQALLQYILIPIVIDKIWEFLNYTQYVLLFVIVGLHLVTLLYVHHVRTVLNL